MAMVQDGLQRSNQPKARYIPFDSPEFYVAKLEEALGTARGRPLSFPELIGRLRTIWADDDRQLVLERLEQMGLPTGPQGQTVQALQLLQEEERRSLPTDQQEQLARTLTELVHQTETLPARERDRADRAVSRLSRLLPVERAWSVIEPWFGDRRAFRRGVVVRVLLKHGVPADLALGVIEQYRSTRDRGLLKLVGRNPHVAALFDEQDVLVALAEPERTLEIGLLRIRDRDALYWKMRAIEVLLIGGRVPSDAIAFDRPMEFVWAVGRQSHRASLPLLRRVLARYRTDPEFVWRCMRAFDRMGDPSDVEHVRALATAIVDAAATNEGFLTSA